MTANTGALHDNGVHTHCTSGPTTQLHRDNRRADQCPKAGTVETWHTHDFDGPLWDACGCTELGTE